MSLSLVTAPATEPLTVAEVRTHLRLDAAAGEIAPTAPTVALAGAGAGNVDNGAHRYRVTYVTADGETEGGEVSAAVTVVDKTTNGKVAVSAIPLGGSAVTSRKLYRTAAAGSTYLLLATIADNTTTTYTDNVADTSLGAEAPATNTTEDPLLVGLLAAARLAAESFTGRALITQTWDLRLDAWPGSERRVSYVSAWQVELCLPLPPLQSVTSVTYLDTANASQTWAASNYLVDAPAGPTAAAGRIVPAYQTVFPSLSYDGVNAVTVRFVAGYGAAGDVPAPIKAGLKMLIGHLYEHRESVDVARGVQAAELPQSTRWLWWPYRVF